ncbi:hypothetical protein Ancab_019234 [Ancistrocladus abbreviatus]
MGSNPSSHIVSSFFDHNTMKGRHRQATGVVTGKRKLSTRGRANRAVIDIYCPLKRDRNGNRFGFVWFLEVRNAHHMVRAMDSIWIGTYKLRVAVARDLKALATVGSSRDAQVQRDEGWMSLAGVHMQFQGMPKTKSYKEALLQSGPCEVTKKSMLEMVFAVRDDEYAWLKGVIAGIIPIKVEGVSFRIRVSEEFSGAELSNPSPEGRCYGCANSYGMESFLFRFSVSLGVVLALRANGVVSAWFLMARVFNGVAIAREWSC